MSGWARKAGLAWDRFWFASGSPLDLAMARILLSGTALWILLSRDLPALSGVPSTFWATVSRSFQWRYLIFPGHEGLERVLYWTTALLLFAVLLGIKSRITAFGAALLLSHFAPMESFQWSSSAFTWSIPVLGLFFLAASPADSALALKLAGGAPAWQYHWPVQMVRVQLAMLYFFSAYSKMIHAGPGWAAPEHMQAWVLGFYQREHPVFTAFAPWVAEHAVLCGAMGSMALAVEFAFPLALFSRRVRNVMVPLVLLMHLGIVLVLNVTVLYWPVLLVFVDWQAAADGWQSRRMRRQTGAPTPPATRSATHGSQILPS